MEHNVGSSTTKDQTQISLHLLDGLRWNSVRTWWSTEDEVLLLWWSPDLSSSAAIRLTFVKGIQGLQRILMTNDILVDILRTGLWLFIGTQLMYGPPTFQFIHFSTIKPFLFFKRPQYQNKKNTPTKTYTHTLWKGSDLAFWGFPFL